VPFIDRSVAVFLLRDRPARLRNLGAPFLSVPRFSAVQARRLNVGRQNANVRRPKGRSIEDGSVRLLGFRSPPAVHAARRSFLPSRVILPWALASLRFDGCERRAFTAACTSGRERVPRRVPPIARSRLSRDRIRSWVCVSSVGLAMSPVSNTSLVVCRVCDVWRSTVRRYSETRSANCVAVRR